MLVQDQILQFLKTTGPTLPTKVAKIIQSEVLIASAHLADLVSQGKAKLSHLKIGGSPLYYLPGQEDQLYSFAPGNLNPKDLAVLEELRVNKILRETALELLPRVALRELKDFAIPLTVRFQDQSELFWKWYLASDEETNQLISQMLTTLPKSSPVEEVSSRPEIEKVTGKNVLSTIRASHLQEREKTIETSVKEPATPRKEASSSKKKRIKNLKQEEVLVELSPEKKEKQKKLEEEKEGENNVTIPEKAEKQEFLSSITLFLKELEITVEESAPVRKNAEINLLITVPSVVGKVKYFCKAKRKGRCDEKELSAAFMEAQMKKLPLLFLYTGMLTRKAQEMIDAGAFENAVVRRLDTNGITI